MRNRQKNIAENKYDKVIRENLERPSKILLNYFFPGEVVKISPLVPKIRQVILEQETDTLVLLELKHKKSFILHWEFQATNDLRIPRRMASYDFMVHLKYNLKVVSVVIYIGNEPMKMNNSVAFNGNYYAYRLIDIRDIDPELFLQSDNPKEIVLAVLAGKDKQNVELIIKRIFIKLQELLPDAESELKERIKDLEIMGNLRSPELQKLIIKEEQKMPIVYDIRKDLRFQQGKTDALLSTAKKMIKKGLDLQLIHETTSLPLSELKKLKRELILK